MKTTITLTALLIAIALMRTELGIELTPTVEAAVTTAWIASIVRITEKHYMKRGDEVIDPEVEKDKEDKNELRN